MVANVAHKVWSTADLVSTKLLNCYMAVPSLLSFIYHAHTYQAQPADTVACHGLNTSVPGVPDHQLSSSFRLPCQQPSKLLKKASSSRHITHYSRPSKPRCWPSRRGPSPLPAPDWPN